MRRLFAVLVLVGIVMAVAYHWKTRSSAVGRVPERLGTLGEKLETVGEGVTDTLRDAKVKGGVKAALELNRTLQPSSIDVDAKDGVVVLKGEVGSEEAKATAKRVAASVPGVTRVEDGLRLNPALASGAPAGDRSLGENIDDRALAAKVKLAYSLDRGMQGSDVAVNSFRREVTLTGRVTSDEQRRLALEVAQQTSGVADVRDQLQVGTGVVAPGGESPAAAASATPTLNERARAAERALAQSGSLSGYVLTVKDEGGRLVVSGRVRTGAEKELASAVAKGAAGVDVGNKIVVLP